MNIFMNVYNKKIDWDKTKAYNLLHEPRVRKMLQFVGANNMVVDIGSYSGDIAKAIQDKGNNIIGLDCNKKFVEMTKVAGVNAMYADFEKSLPIKDKSVDLVFAGEVIEHIYHTEIFLKEAHRVLKDGGELIISTPNLAYWGHRIKLLFGVAPNILGYESGEDLEANPGHV